ncbi:MAG TPA: response regulator [Terriglobia bacterium]|nr:response regulator [Terriglobia bacterium]
MSQAAHAKILVVDDDASYAGLLVDCFTGLGFQVVYARSGEEALQLAADLKPDIVLLDIIMPEMDGFKVCQKIRELPEGTNTIVIMLTSKGEVEDKIKGIDIGANDYLVKPSGLSELFEVVARVNRFLDTKSRYLRKMEDEKFLTLRGAANTVCHEINNPLTTIVGAARLISKTLDQHGHNQDEELKKEAESILQACHRIQSITHQLARAIRVVTTEPVPGIKMIDLNASSKQD